MVCLGVISLKTIYDKKIISSVFCDIWNNQSFGNVSFGVTVTLTLIIQDITKTTSRGIV